MVFAGFALTAALGIPCFLMMHRYGLRSTRIWFRPSREQPMRGQTNCREMLMVNRTVLVADDSQTVRVLTQRALRAAGYEVVLAENGQQAVEMAGLHRPQIVILDIQMPIMDGYEACDRILRLENNLPNLRIIFLTSERGQQLDQLGRQYGAYLPKPFNEQLLLSTMQGLFDRGTDVNVCCNTGSSLCGEDSGSAESRCPSQMSLCSE